MVYVLKREALDRVKDVVPEVPCQAAGGGRASQARQRAEKQRERRHQDEQAAVTQDLVHTAAGLYLVHELRRDEGDDALHHYFERDEDGRQDSDALVFPQAHLKKFYHVDSSL